MRHRAAARGTLGALDCRRAAVQESDSMRLDLTVSVPVVRTARTLQLEGLFEIPPSQRSEQRWSVEIPIEGFDWHIGLIVGPSGSGKSTLAREAFGENLVRGYTWSEDKSVVDG